MHTIKVTYRAPPFESKVTELFGYTFFDGKPETVTVDDRVLKKLQNHAHFECGEADDELVQFREDEPREERKGRR